MFAAISSMVIVAVGPAPGSMTPASGSTGSGLWGGGFENVVAVDPNGTGTVIAGSDVGGLQRSTDQGATFTARNAAASRLADLTVASVQFATQTSNVYAATGEDIPGISGFWNSADDGQTWIRLGTGSLLPLFNGFAQDGVAYRSTGKLIALDESSNPDGHPAHIYVAAVGGVLRSDDGGATWTAIGMTSAVALRGIALDPADPSILYAASYADGVYETSNANDPDPAAVTFAPISGLSIPASPLYPEELLPIAGPSGDSLYVAAAAHSPDAPSAGGIYQWANGTWSELGAGTLSSSAVWFGLDGWVSSDGLLHLVAGCRASCGLNPGTGLYQDVYRSDDGGGTWASLLTDASLVHSNQVGGPGGGPWWLAATSPTSMLAGSAYGVSQVAVDPTDPDRMFLSGRSGVWKSEDAGTNWYPCVAGMLVTQAQGVATDPSKPGAVYAAVWDWGLIYSYDHGATVGQARPKGGGTVGVAVAVDPVSSRVYVSTGSGSAFVGNEIFSTQTPGTTSWISERLGAASGEGGARADSMAVEEVGGHAVLIAAVQGSGIWRKVEGSIPGRGTWTRVLADPAFGALAQISWLQSSATVFAYDPSSGHVWMSPNSGKGWGSAPVATIPSAIRFSGFMAASPFAPYTAFVSTDTGLWSVRGGPAPSAALLSFPVAVPGPVAVDATGTVWVAARPLDTQASGLFRSTDGGSTWTEVGDDFAHNTALFPTAVAVGADGYQYESLYTSGFTVTPPVSP